MDIGRMGKRMRLSDILKSGAPHYTGENAIENIIPAVEKLEETIKALKQTNTELFDAMVEIAEISGEDTQAITYHIYEIAKDAIAKAEQK